MIETPLTLPCGSRIPNRLCKAAMTEGLADSRGRVTPGHLRVYQAWARGGAGLLVTGNIMIDGRYLERAGNLVAQDETAVPGLRSLTQTVHQAGGLLWGQISHPGRQCQRLVAMRPLAPSDVQLDFLGNFGKPRAATEADIAEIIERFATTAALLQSAGFDGVQIHAAHGYLLSQFLSARTNLRQDRWGGSTGHRARLLLEVVRAVRARVGAAFPVSVKLNSSDFVKGGFTIDQSVEVATLLGAESIDVLEVSGGTYEQLEFFKAHDESEIRDSTRAREAHFLTYAREIKAVARMPVMVTGGFRTRAGMEAALRAGETDLIGLARPFCLDPSFPAKMLAGTLDRLPVPEDKLVLGRGYWGPNSPSSQLRLLNGLSQAGWYYNQIERLAAGKEPKVELTPLAALAAHLANDTARGLRRRMAGVAAARKPA